MNKVYSSVSAKIPLGKKALADAANAISRVPVFTEWDFDYKNPKCRIAGEGHCDCGGNGEFVLLPLSDPDVREGGKRYMQCRKCGGWSHL